VTSELRGSWRGFRLRRQLPVHSPLRLESIAAGLSSAFAGEQAIRDLSRVLDERYGPHDLTLTDSGTSALTLAIAAVGGPVALPAFCCFDVATAADGAGADPILYDLDPLTLAPEPESLVRALAAGARSVVAVHLYGVPVPVPAIRAAAAASGAIVIEDAAQATGARYGGHRVGTMGSFGILSFGRGKGVTGGGGGALLSNDPAAAARLEALDFALEASRLPPRDVVATAAQWLLARPAIYGLPASLPFLGLGGTVYRRPHAPGGMSAFSSGVLRSSLHVEDREAELRRKNAARLTKAIEATGGRLQVATAKDPSARCGYLRLPVLVEDAALLPVMRSEAAARLGILPSYPVSLADLPAFAERVVNRGEEFAGARKLAQRLVTVPVHGLVTAKDQQRIIEFLKGLL
jgi:dTDP-4-amino-4,6-dideoxygalactose transaminase